MPLSCISNSCSPVAVNLNLAWQENIFSVQVRECKENTGKLTSLNNATKAFGPNKKVLRSYQKANDSEFICPLELPWDIVD
mmetsp:Transcript_20181/g.53799  ORF Transcript_20181/g.53799 Transcript_20181/m.53799 type:complete len:81 (-) Transcript_20181:15-257(-)